MAKQTLIDLAEPRAALARLAEDRPSLAAPAAVLNEVLPILFADAAPAEFALAEAAALEKLSSGVPLVRGESWRVDERAFQRRWSAICAAVQRHQAAADARQLSVALRNGALSIDDMVRHVLAGQRAAIGDRAHSLGLNEALTMSVLRLTLFPAMWQIQTALAPVLARGGWTRGYCGVCGSWPLLAERRGLEQFCFLRCGLCAADWEFSRLCCPFCELRDHRRLGYLEIEGQDGQQLATTCGNCRGYVKTVFTLGALDPPGLLVSDVATLHLDLAAAERGYVVPTKRPD